MLLSPIENIGTLADGLHWVQERPYITQKFGVNPITYGKFGLDGHNGLDFRAKIGTPIYAPIEGVAKVGDQGKTGYGKYVKIRSADKEITLGHFSSVLVKDGDLVRLGQQVGKSGNTGFSTGPHLHFGLRYLIPDSRKDPWSLEVKGYSNGYFGFVDPTEFVLTWKGTLALSSDNPSAT